ncbi:MAG TPA: transglycosylase domain-containing protein [Ktedonobacterales bacterium]|nr:transglycosylase domain-containing protein [Ktedonobacterales bacterium]
MSQKPASSRLSQEEQEQRRAWLSRHLSGLRNDVPLPFTESDHLRLPVVTPDISDTPPLKHPGRARPTRQRARRRRRWKRRFLRRSLRREKARGRALIRSCSLGALMPLLLLITIITMLAGVALLYYQSEQDALAHIGSDLPGDSLKIYDAQGNLIYDMADHGLQTTLPLRQIPNVLQHATIAIEDKDFWTNQGVDFQAVIRATIDDLRSGQIVSGGSTITQQLIKNALLGPQVTLDRKLREMILALGLTHQMSKRDILTLYLNTIYYGEQSYGIDAAAHAYFSLNDQPGVPAAAQLDLAQASLLAGLPRSPSDLDPLHNLSGALARQKAVLEQMVIQGYIRSAQETQAIAEAKQPGFLKPSAPANLAPQFSNYVLRQVQMLIDQHVLSTGDLSRSGLRIYTTLNISLQNQILQIARQHIADLAANNVTNAAVVLIDYHTGAILTELGSIDYNDAQIDGQFDVATQGWRQPGSSFKPFVYATAFEEGWSPGTPISDSPISIPIPNQPNYSPQNYDGKFHGNVTVRQALQNSFNVPAVKTLMFAGIQQSLNTAESMGISGYQGTPGYSMVLGGLDVKLIDETSAYGVFGNGGVRVPPYAIQVITDASGKVLYHHVTPPGTQVISPQVAGLITNVLSDDKSRQYEFGVCSPLLLYNGPSYSPGCYADDTDNVRPAAVKTGTTQDFKDNWTVGYTTDFVMGVWAGNNDGSPMYNVSGVDGAAPIWHDAMLVAEQNRPVQNFTLPHGLLYATVHYPDGVTSTDWYLPGTVPAGGIILGQS